MFTELGNTPLFVICSAVIILNDPLKQRAFYQILFLSFGLWLMNITKMAYSEARPYFISSTNSTDENILPYGSCSVEFGNPSGHALFSTGYSIFIVLDVIAARTKRLRMMYYASYEDAKTRNILLLVLGSLAFIFGISISYSRIFLRVHTFNQVVFGWTLGVWLGLSFHFLLRSRVMKLLN